MLDVWTPEFEKAILKRDYQSNFFEFAKEAWSPIDSNPLIVNWTWEAICDHLQATYDGEIRNLNINIPPGFSKSMLTAVLFPAWLWANDPKLKIFSVAHSMNLAGKHNLFTRRLVLSE